MTQLLNNTKIRELKKLQKASASLSQITLLCGAQFHAEKKQQQRSEWRQTTPEISTCDDDTSRDSGTET